MRFVDISIERRALVSDVGMGRRPGVTRQNLPSLCFQAFNVLYNPCLLAPTLQCTHKHLISKLKNISIKQELSAKSADNEQQCYLLFLFYVRKLTCF